MSEVPLLPQALHLSIFSQPLSAWHTIREDLTSGDAEGQAALDAAQVIPHLNDKYAPTSREAN
ncbi:hypothetical protein LTR56_025892, partial [Elasticomyces elasticus]